MPAHYIKNGRVFWYKPEETKEQTILTSPEIVVPQTVTNFAFEIYCYGLKPSTRHYFFDGNVKNNRTAQCEPIGGKQGDFLITDASGQLSFKYYFTGDTVISGSSTLIPASGNTANATITQAIVSEGARLFIVTASPEPWENYSSVESSYADFAVTISAGTGDITAPVTPTQPVYESGGAISGGAFRDDASLTVSRKLF